ncbi:NAD(P)H-dependent oxidoreductase [Congregibacter sp.]|uniref:NAD(P)H-dependent oxidoreductase n=1 Tax=Congregibacter sp. TaxID=2744308 RepID=UPI00385A25D6
MSERRILVLFAHPSPGRSEINRHLATVAKEHPHATFVDLYAEYPDYRIDIDKEQQRLCEHDVIVFLFPLYWYSTPALLKEWQDLVLEHGFAYGSEGTALAGKYFLCACSAGGAGSAYDVSGYNHHSLRDLLVPLEQTATLCHMRYIPPFALFSSRTAVEEGRREAHLRAFSSLLDQLASASLETWAQSDACTINELFADNPPEVSQ